MSSKSWTIKLQTLDKRIKAFASGYRQNIAILGDDAEEISYLLENYFAENKPHHICLHTTTSYVTRKEFFKSIVFSLLSEYANTCDTVDSLIIKTKAALPLTTDFITDCLKKNNISFLNSLEVINKFINETQQSCILIIEEFPDLKSLFGDFYQDFSKFIILQRNCMVVLTASLTRSAVKILSGELNLLFGNFEKVSISEAVSLEQFLYFKDMLMPVSPSPLLSSFFINIIGENIRYYDILASVVKNNYFPDDEENSIITTINAALYSKESYFFQKFIRKIEFLRLNFKDFFSAVNLLFALSDGYLRKSELRSLLICRNVELNARLQKLMELGYIENLGNIYKIKDTLFSFWLSCVFKLYSRFPILLERQREAVFQQKIREKITLFKEEFFKDKIKKVLGLFSSFQDDLLKIGKFNYNLPTIQRSKVISYPEKNFHLLVGEGREIIFAGIKEKETNDTDIFDFIERTSNIKGKRVKKIFISLDTLPNTARVIAKNNRLMIWDVNDLNYLLNIYNKPPVMENI